MKKNILLLFNVYLIFYSQAEQIYTAFSLYLINFTFNMKLSEFNQAQSVPQPILCQSAAIAGGAWEGLLLEDRPCIRSEADRTGIP